MASVASCATATSVKIGGLPPEATTDVDGGALTATDDCAFGDPKGLDAVAEATGVGAPDGVTFVAWVDGLHAAAARPIARIPASLNARTARPRRRQ
jgi:hypothetical protein